MKPPISYFGGKSRLADWIAGMLPPHRVYVEPFMGSGAVFFAKQPAKHEILNDLDGEVVNFFRMLRERPDDLELACQLTPYARQEYAEAVVAEPAEDPVERARQWFVLSTQSFGAISKRGTGWSTSIVQNSNNPRTVRNRIARFALAAARLSEATIEQRDALEIVVQYDATDAVMYLDPPYLGDVRTSHRDGRRPHGDYVHEFATNEEHRELAAIVHTLEAHVIVSGYASDLYEELYPDWHRIDRQVLARASQRRGAGIEHRVEVLWSNRELERRLFA